MVPEHRHHVTEGSEVSARHLVQLNVIDRGGARAPLQFQGGDDDLLPMAGLNADRKELSPRPHSPGLHQLGIDSCSVRHRFTVFLRLYEKNKRREKKIGIYTIK